MKDSEQTQTNTLPTIQCPATPDSFKSLATSDSFRSKGAVFSIDKSDLIVELYNKKGCSGGVDPLDDTIRSSNRQDDMLLRKIPKFKPRGGGGGLA